jgi:hypothetical protein
MDSGLACRERVNAKLEFVAFFDTQEDAEAAAVEAGIDFQACWITYREAGFRPEKDSED